MTARIAKTQASPYHSSGDNLLCRRWFCARTLFFYWCSRDNEDLVLDSGRVCVSLLNHRYLFSKPKGELRGLRFRIKAFREFFPVLNELGWLLRVRLLPVYQHSLCTKIQNFVTTTGRLSRLIGFRNHRGNRPTQRNSLPRNQVDGRDRVQPVRHPQLIRAHVKTQVHWAYLILQLQTRRVYLSLVAYSLPFSTLPSNQSLHVITGRWTNRREHVAIFLITFGPTHL